MSEAPPSTSQYLPGDPVRLRRAKAARQAFPMSDGVPSLPMGVHPPRVPVPNHVCTASGRVFKTLSSVQPGLIALTVICREASATAK